jgi:hypothetical protein
MAPEIIGAKKPHTPQSFLPLTQRGELWTAIRPDNVKRKCASTRSESYLRFGKLLAFMHPPAVLKQSNLQVRCVGTQPEQSMQPLITLGCSTHAPECHQRRQLLGTWSFNTDLT